MAVSVSPTLTPEQQAFLASLPPGLAERRQRLRDELVQVEHQAMVAALKQLRDDPYHQALVAGFAQLIAEEATIPHG